MYDFGETESYLLIGIISICLDLSLEIEKRKKKLQILQQLQYGNTGSKKKYSVNDN